MAWYWKGDNSLDPNQFKQDIGRHMTSLPDLKNQSLHGKGHGDVDDEVVGDFHEKPSFQV